MNNPKPFGIIYKATFPNGKCYIGQTTKTLKHRIGQHLYNLNRENLAFHNAIKKYGEDGLTWSAIDTADDLEELNRKEMFWIEFHKSYVHNEYSNGYNLTRGGDGSMGFRHSKETCLKLRSDHLGTKASDETRLKMSVTRKGKTNGHLGTKASDETRAKMSATSRGESNGNAKLTWVQVHEIRARYVFGKISTRELATIYKVNKSAIVRIVANQAWKEQPTVNSNVRIGAVEE